MRVRIDDIILIFLSAVAGAGLWDGFISPRNTYWGSIIAVVVCLIYKRKDIVSFWKRGG